MIALKDCKHGYLYRIKSRNLSVGVFNKDNSSFIGIREKFGSRYLFSEYHRETGPPHGTVSPTEEIGPLPPGVEISERHEIIDSKTRQPISFDVPKSQGGKGWYFKYNGESDPNIEPVIQENTELLQILEHIPQ
jgi:hypothetical protein